MDPCFHVLYTKFWPFHLNVAAEIETHQTRQLFLIFYCPTLVSLCELYPPFPVLSRQERHTEWSSAAVAHLLQGSTCCAFRDGIQHTLVIMSGYLSYCCLSIISNQCAHSPLTSTRPFHPHNCRSLKIFYFSDHSPWTLEMVVRENPSRSAVFEILRPARLAPTTIPRSKSLKSPFFPVLMLGLNFSKSSSPHLDA